MLLTIYCWMDHYTEFSPQDLRRKLRKRSLAAGGTWEEEDACESEDEEETCESEDEEED